MESTGWPLTQPDAWGTLPSSYPNDRKRDVWRRIGGFFPAFEELKGLINGSGQKCEE